MDNKKFGEFISQIYPKELVLKKTNNTDDEAEYLDLFIKIDKDNVVQTKLYDKRDFFQF